MMSDELALHRELIDHLQHQLVQSHGRMVERIETHISSVLLAGDYAYKIKKPLDLGFLDFSTLQRRRFCCDEEIRLNRRLAPGIYIDVVPITGSVQAPRLGGEGEAVEYAVRMRRFPDDALLSSRPGTLDHGMARTIARVVAAFHAGIAVAQAETSFGEPEVLLQPMQANFDHIRQIMQEPSVLKRLAEIERWTLDRFSTLRPLFETRKAEGFIRECHGDLHLGNIAWVDDAPLIFDGIEFNPDLRWIDTFSELAFLLMDLDEKGRQDLSRLVLNHYLQVTGDFGGLPLLRFYQVYRAMVRAKVASIRLGQEGLGVSEHSQIMQEFSLYLSLAERYTHPGTPGIVITHGLSGSGKSTLAIQVVQALGAVQLRSDVERKRLAGLTAVARTDAAISGGIYSGDFTRRTYERLAQLSELVVSSGFTAVVDATFLNGDQRLLFQGLSERLDLPYALLDIQVHEDELRRRVSQRVAEGSDPSEADISVLESQLASYTPLAGEELNRVIAVSPEDKLWRDQLLERLGISSNSVSSWE
ncbi:MAG: AAA family ATPase [Candidatus Sedimenticola sp. 20ELBAFRAG]